MVEITPIISSPTVVGLRKIERDEARKNKPQQQPRPGKTDVERSESDEHAEVLPSDGSAIQHIDERA